MLAVADSLRRLAADPESGLSEPLEIHLVGTRTGLETHLFAASGLPCHYLVARPLPARKGLRWLAAALRIGWALAQALLLLRRLRPRVVVGMGGYASVCVLRAAQWLGIPTHVHENDSHPGKANQVLARRAVSLSTGFAGVADRMGRPDGSATGNPLRPEFAAPDGARGRARLGLAAETPLVVVTGGSRGAVALNQAAVRAVERVAGAGGEMVLVTGRGNLADAARQAEALPDAVRPRLHLVEYVEEGMADLLAAADVVVSRSGAMTVYELAACGAPAFLVPYPYATQEHQRTNAEIYAASGAGVVVDQSEAVREGALAEMVGALLDDGPRRASMREAARRFARADASERVARLVLATAEGKGRQRHG